VVGVARTAQYGDIVIGIPYDKKHMFDTQVTNHTGGNNYRKTYPNFANRYSMAGNSPYIGSVAVDVKPNYRRASVALPYRSIYDDIEYDTYTPSRYGSTSKRYDPIDYEIEWPTKRPASIAALTGRAQSVQRQLDGIPEFQLYTPTLSTSRPVSRPPSFRPPSVAPVSRASVPPSIGSSSGGSYGGAPASSAAANQSRKYTKPPVSEARRKVRDLLCKSKNDPRYFDD